MFIRKYTILSFSHIKFTYESPDIKISVLFLPPVLVGSSAVVELYCEVYSSDLSPHRRRPTTHHPRWACACPNSAAGETCSYNLVSMPIHCHNYNPYFFVYLVGKVLINYPNRFSKPNTSTNIPIFGFPRNTSKIPNHCVIPIKLSICGNTI